jgi:glycosyltransferase involved in cell wall biosynthesis
MISIALCTYNGSRYLKEQLESIAGQTRPPDELIIRDDRSTDDTVEIARRFAETASFLVQVHVNSENVGSTRNFELAIEDCSGDIIALSDQDDLWMPRRLERLESEFAADPRVGLVFSDAELTDENLSPLGVRLWRETFKRRDQGEFEAGRAVDVLLQYNVVTGATMAFRSSLRPAILPIPKLTEFIHDGWISLVAALTSRVRFVREPLIKYRQHPGQQLGAGLSRWGIPRLERFRLTVESRSRTSQRLNEFLEVFSDAKLDVLRGVALDRLAVPDRAELERMIIETQARIDDNVEHLKRRLALPNSRVKRLPQVLDEWRTGRYYVHSRGWQSVLLDVVRK